MASYVARVALTSLCFIYKTTEIEFNSMASAFADTVCKELSIIYFVLALGYAIALHCIAWHLHWIEFCLSVLAFESCIMVCFFSSSIYLVCYEKCLIISVFRGPGFQL